MTQFYELEKWNATSWSPVEYNKNEFFFSFEQVSSFLSGHQQKTSFNISQSKNKSKTPFKIQPNIWSLSKQAMIIIAWSKVTICFKLFYLSANAQIFFSCAWTSYFSITTFKKWSPSHLPGKKSFREGCPGKSC